MRIEATATKSGTLQLPKLQDGEYGKDPRRNVWIARPPASGHTDLTEEQGYTVTENKDGTISVAEIIDTGMFYGTLEQGIFIEQERPIEEEVLVSSVLTAEQ